MKTPAKFLIIGISFIFLFSCNSINKDKPIIDCLKELPKELRPSFVEDTTYKEFTNPNRSKEYTVETSEDGKFMTFNRNDANLHLTVNVLNSEDGFYLAYCSTVFESYEINIFKNEENKWKKVTNLCLPKEIATILGTDLRIFPEIRTDTLNIEDMDDDSKRVTIVWDENKYVLSDPIPEKLGQSLME